MIEEDLDEALAKASAAQRMSKAALIRRAVRQTLEVFPPIEEDPLWDIVGMGDSEPVDIDSVVYG